MVAIVVAPFTGGSGRGGGAGNCISADSSTEQAEENQSLLHRQLCEELARFEDKVLE
jgi:hypothetical protein